MHGHFVHYQLSNGSLRDAADDVMLLFENSGIWKFPNSWTVRFLNVSELVAISQVLSLLQTLFLILDLFPSYSAVTNILNLNQKFSVFTMTPDMVDMVTSWLGGLEKVVKLMDLTSDLDVYSLFKFTTGDGIVRALAMVKVEWYKSHPNKDMYGTGLQLWNRDNFEDFGPASYIPIHCINSKFAPAYGSVNITTQTTSAPVYESVLFVCPLRSNNFL